MSAAVRLFSFPPPRMSAQSRPSKTRSVEQADQEQSPNKDANSLSENAIMAPSIVVKTVALSCSQFATQFPDRPVCEPPDVPLAVLS